MESFKTYLQASGKSQSTIRHYVNHASEFLAWLERDNTTLESATAKEVTGYLNYLQQKGQSNDTRALRLTAINHLFHHEIEQGNRIAHPSKHLKIRGKQQNKLYPVLTRAQLESIYLDYQIPAETDPRSNRNWFKGYLLGKKRNKVILGLMIYQGITTTEIEKIEVPDIDLRSGTLHIKSSRKTNERTLELKPGQIMDIMEYQLQTRPEILRYYTQPTNALFLSIPKSGVTTAKDGFQIWKGLKAELTECYPFFVGFQQLRVSVIVGWLNRFNLREVQYMAGHRFVSSTEKYLLHQVEDLQADIDKFHPMG